LESGRDPVPVSLIYGVNPAAGGEGLWFCQFKYSFHACAFFCGTWILRTGRNVYELLASVINVPLLKGSSFSKAPKQVYGVYAYQEKKKQRLTIVTSLVNSIMLDFRSGAVSQKCSEGNCPNAFTGESYNESAVARVVFSFAGKCGSLAAGRYPANERVS